jgi:hypothetical protein
MNQTKKVIAIFLIYCFTYISFDFAIGKLYKIPWVMGYIEHPDVDFSLRPGSSGWFTREGESFVSINNIGSNDSKNRFNKSSDVLRIAVIGDSYVEALQVPTTKSFWYLLEEQLSNTCPRLDKKYEIVPLGVSGHGPVQYLKTLQTRAKDLNVDFNIVLFTPGNDIRNSSPQLELGSSRYSLISKRSFISIEADDRLIIKEYKNSSMLLKIYRNIITENANLIEKSNFLKLSIEFATRLKNWNTSRINNKDSSDPIFDESAIYLPDNRLTKSWKDAKLLTKKSVELIGKYSEKSPVFAVIGTSPTQVTPNSKEVESLLGNLKVPDLKEPNRFFSNLFKENQIEYLDLLKYIKINENEEGLHGVAPYWGGHWNSKGHKLVSNVLSQELCPIISKLKIEN